MFRKIIFYILNMGLIISSVLVLTLWHPMRIGSILRYILIFSPQIMFILALLFRYLKIKIVYKILLCLHIITCICIILYTYLYSSGLIQNFSSINSLKRYILSTREKGVFVYILTQLLQVVFLPIPASIICIVGSLIYGPVLGALYCCIGVVIGSYISYFVGKIFGYKLVSWIVGKDNTDKYSEIISRRGCIFLALAFLLPMFPDDILCFIAGTTKMKPKIFLWVTLITRPIGVICMAIFGSGYIIPFSGWGIYVWITILLVAVALVYVVFKWQERLQTYVLNKVFQKVKKRTKD